MLKTLLHSCTGLLFTALLLGSGCATPGPRTNQDDNTALSNDEWTAFFKKARDPRRFSVTTYTSKSGPVFVGTDRLHHGQLAELPFVSAKDSFLPVISFRGRTPDFHQALLDSSSFRTYFDLVTAVELRMSPLNPGDRITPPHVEDAVESYAAIADKLRFDQLHMETALCYIRLAKGPLGPLARGLVKPVLQMVVGTEMMKSFEFVQVDYPARTVRLSSTRQHQPAASQLMADLRTYYPNGALAVDGAVDGKPTRFIIDFAGAYEVVLPEEPSTPVRQVSLGDLVFLNPAVAQPEDLGLGFPGTPRIGAGLLRRYRVTLAKKGLALRFERPASNH